MTATHIVFDLETTGLDPVVHEAIQVAALLLDDDLVEVAHFVAMMRPLRPETASQEALDVHGYSLDRLAQERHPEIVWEEFCSFLDDHAPDQPLRYVGQNGHFDLGFLAECESAYGFLIDRHELPIDVIHLARIHLEARGKTANSRLGTLTAYYGIEHQAHDALGDVRATAEVLRRIKAEAPDLVATAYRRPVYKWLLEQADRARPGSSFVESLASHYKTRGFLSPKQITALVRCLPVGAAR